MSLKFGTSGLRGLSVDLKGRPSYVYAAAFAVFLLRSGLAKVGDRLLVAYDFRESSPAIAANVMAAVRDHGLVAVDCGLIPTPALAFYGFQTGAASMMVTGSHIPADRNGIKFYLPDGEIAKPDEMAILAIANELYDIAIPATIAGTDFDNGSEEATSLFMRRNQSLLPTNALAGMRVGNYQHSTVARDMLSKILRYYGAEVVDLGRSTDFIPVDTEAVSQATLDLLKAWAVEHRLDAIISADGDGDRPLIADEYGEPVSGDLCGLIAARFLGADAIVTPITSNSGIDRSGFAQVTRTRVGSPYVIAGMQDALNGCAGVVGFEANGGTLTASTFQVASGELLPLPTRNSFLPILAVLSSARAAGLTLSDSKVGLGLPVTAADRLENYATERSAALMAKLRGSEEQLRQFVEPLGALAGIDETDGLRVVLMSGKIVHFRPSGNAPEMRCYVEDTDAESARGLLDDGLRLLREFQA